MLLFIVIILFVFLLIVPIFGENILNLMKKADLLAVYANEIIVVFNALKWPLTIFIIYFNIKLLYTISPSKNIKSRETTYGAVFTTVCWIFASIIFKFYLTYFARYDIIYGNLSSLIILMVWVYFLSFIFVLGIGINASKYEKEEIKENSQNNTEVKDDNPPKEIKEISKKKKTTKKKEIKKESKEE